MKKTMKLQILMAGNYDISKGKKIDFCLDEQKNIYIASCEKAAFGLLKALIRGNRAQLRKMGTNFSGTAIKVLPEKHYMMVKVPVKRRQKMDGRRKNSKGRKTAA